MGVAALNPQSTGSVTLRSSSANDKPVIDHNKLSHPYDIKIMIECVKAGMQFVKSPALEDKWQRWLLKPKSESDDDILVSYFQCPSHTCSPTATCSCEFHRHTSEKLPSPFFTPLVP